MQIESGNEQFVHHIVIYGCRQGSNVSQYVDHPVPCYDENVTFMSICSNMLMAWAVGGEVSHVFFVTLKIISTQILLN